ncbi:hypothetical protein K490DRAFT_53431 [Saccharata proteae CBS 121410]|uniref:Secreted protein n=1 Tax=Saccharata proteae CBS 121410 TaxID=1314787 RepID=A0A9P4M0H8_9PEZI|nr:hypothetical protein K490DRAFT_53431 [Saccharata proteae CBS 121410]
MSTAIVALLWHCCSSWHVPSSTDSREYEQAAGGSPMGARVQFDYDTRNGCVFRLSWFQEADDDVVEQKTLFSGDDEDTRFAEVVVPRLLMLPAVTTAMRVMTKPNKAWKRLRT